MMCPRWLGRAMRPLYRLRGVIVSRKFGGRSRWYDRHVRAFCERILDAVEMWESRPAFEAMEAQIRECDRLAADLLAIRKEFNLDGDR